MKCTVCGNKAVYSQSCNVWYCPQCTNAELEKRFVNKLIEITGCSKEYAFAAWQTLHDSYRDNPENAAKDYAKRYLI